MNSAEHHRAATLARAARAVWHGQNLDCVIAAPSQEPPGVLQVALEGSRCPLQGRRCGVRRPAEVCRLPGRGRSFQREPSGSAIGVPAPWRSRPLQQPASRTWFPVLAVGAAKGASASPRSPPIRRLPEYPAATEPSARAPTPDPAALGQRVQARGQAINAEDSAADGKRHPAFVRAGHGTRPSSEMSTARTAQGPEETGRWPNAAQRRHTGLPRSTSDGFVSAPPAAPAAPPRSAPSTG